MPSPNFICHTGLLSTPLPAEAEDIIQDFFTRLVSKESLSGLQRDGGRFRSFLLGALNNFLANEWDRAQAQKRGGGQRPLSLNVEEGEARFALEVPASETPESLFERLWAFTLLEHVTDQLRDEYVGASKRELFDHLRGCLQGDRSGPPHATVAKQCGMSEGGGEGGGASHEASLRRTAAGKHRPNREQRFKERTSAERVNSRLKERYGGRWVRMRGADKVGSHLAFGLLALTVAALLARLG